MTAHSVPAPERFQIHRQGKTLRIVDCAEHPPEVAPSMCFIGGDADVEIVQSRAELVCAALNALHDDFFIEPHPGDPSEPIDVELPL